MPKFCTSCSVYLVPIPSLLQKSRLVLTQTKFTHQSRTAFLLRLAQAWGTTQSRAKGAEQREPSKESRAKRANTQANTHRHAASICPLTRTPVVKMLSHGCFLYCTTEPTNRCPFNQCYFLLCRWPCSFPQLLQPVANTQGTHEILHLCREENPFSQARDESHGMLDRAWTHAPVGLTCAQHMSTRVFLDFGPSFPCRVRVRPLPSAMSQY